MAGLIRYDSGDKVVDTQKIITSTCLLKNLILSENCLSSPSRSKRCMCIDSSEISKTFDKAKA